MRLDRRALLPLLLLAVMGTAGLCWAQTGADPEQGQAPRTVERVTAPTAMAVTANPHATRAAVAVLKAGGNAIDAAVTAQFVLNVVEPQSSGIGGGGFLMLYLAGRDEVVAIDGREESPAGATPRMFLAPDGEPLPFFPQRITGGRAVAVPGLLKALALAQARYGTYPLARTLGPAIRLAEDGFAVSPRLARSLQRHRKRLALFPATRAVFFDARGEPLRAGALLRQAELAGAFRLLAAEGIAPFYRGPIARAIVRAVSHSPVAPGPMTLGDLAGYEAVLRAPVKRTYRGYTLYGMGPPSSGATTVFQMLNLLETQPPASGGPLSAAAVHRFVQAVRLAYADRARYLGDGDFVRVPVEGLLDKAYAARRARGIDWDGPLTPVEPGHPPGAQARRWGSAEMEESPSTTHLAVVDRERNLVSMTTTIEQAFGSGIVVPGWGFLLNNEMTDFAARAADPRGRLLANRIEEGTRPRRTALENAERPGGKRPRSSMAPTLVFSGGRPLLVLGSPGGSRIIQYVAEVLLRVLDYGMDLQSAIEAPHHTHARGRTRLEQPLARTGLPEALRRLGHTVRIAPQASGLHGVWIDPATGTLHGGADPRREGVAAGY